MSELSEVDKMTESEDSFDGEEDSDDDEDASLSDHMYFRRMLTDTRPKTLKSFASTNTYKTLQVNTL